MERVVSRDGTPIAFSRSGAGPTLVLVHGTTADHTRWAFVAPRLERHFELVAMDRRGRGGSGDGPAYSIEREAEDIVAVVEAQGAPVRVLGHSYGALCTLEAAVRTDRIERMALYEPPLPAGEPLYAPGTSERLQELVDKGRGEEALLVMLGEIVGMSDDELEAMRRPPGWERRLSMVGTIPRETRVEETYRFEADRIARVTTPTLLIAGETSARFLRLAADLLNGVLPDSRLEVMAGQGHVAMTTAPDLFVDSVLPFMLGA
jgi:pimeloyl-ACP methyl ester carboxylesterase